MQKVDVVIPNFNQTDKLRACITSLREFNPEVGDIVIVNDHGPERIQKEVRAIAHETNCRLIVNQWERGFSATVNIGLKQAKTEIVLLLNDDTYCTQPNIKQALVHFADPKVGVVGSLQLMPDNTVQHAGIKHNANITTWFEHKLYGQPAFRAQINHATEEFAVTASVQFIRRSLLDVYGYYDEAYRLSFEDIDFCLRLFTAGVKIIYEPRSMFYHYGGSTRGQKEPKGWDIYSQKLFWMTWYKRLKTTSGVLVKPVVIPPEWGWDADQL